VIARSKLAEIDQVGTTRARQVMDAACSEEDFQATVVAYAHLRGWMVYHPWSSKHSESGYPDLTMTRHGRLVFAELKTQKGRVSREQAVWLNALEGTGARCFLWRPGDWPAVEEELL